jgi:hypothetical protein
MIRRAAITLLFAILGIASLLFFDAIDVRVCELFPSILHCRARFPQCGLDCSQSWSLSQQVGAFFFFFGPSIVFAMTGFFFSKQPRRAWSWGALLVCLVATHSVVMIAAS